MTFPQTQFAGLGLIDYINGATPQEFFKESDATQWDDEIIALTSGLRSGQFRLVFNDTGVLIEKGKPVKLGAFNVPNSAPVVTLAQANAIANLADGIALADIAIGAVGIIVKRLVITGLNTSSFTVLDDIFLSASVPGDLTAVAGLQRLGRVTVDDAVNGQIEFDVERGGGGLAANSVTVLELEHQVKSFRDVTQVNTAQTNSTVLATILSVLLPGTTGLDPYFFRALLWTSQVGAIADMKLRVDFTGSFPAGQLLYSLWDYGLDNAAFDPNTNNLNRQAGNADVVVDQPAAGDYLAVIEGYLRNSSPAAETLSIQLAQNTSDPAAFGTFFGCSLDVKGAL